jgi:LasA protease
MNLKGYRLRKSIQYSLVLILFLVSACNLPRKSLPGIADKTKTIAPVILKTQQNPTIVLQTPDPQLVPTASNPLGYDPSRFDSYTVQSGDTLNVVAAHFGAVPGEILSSQPIPSQGLLPNHQTLVIPKLTDQAPFSRFLLPDSEIVNSPCGSSFDIQKFVNEANGRLSTYTQVVDSRNLSGAEVVKLVSENTSTNPHFLLAFIEFRSHWVLGNPPAPDLAHPLGLNILNNEGLFNELSIYTQLLNIGYYAWRQGKMTRLPFADGSSVRISPYLNAGSVALQYLFARSFDQSTWEDELYGPNGFLSTYQAMFGDPIACARTIEPFFPDAIQMPTLELPFAPGEPWALTGGLHEDWIVGTPLGALDFAPITGEAPCVVSRAWVLASASGTVTRSENGALQLALTDEAGKMTGWELFYMHVAEKDRAAIATQVKTNDPIGHPSCEGGVATGTHVHLARLYRGEWIGAGDPFPYILSGWLAKPGEKPYQSSLVKGGQVVVSNINGTNNAKIIR